MELVWELRGYAIDISVLKSKGQLIKARQTEKQVTEPALPYRRAEQAHEDLLRNSGSRFVGPMR